MLVATIIFLSAICGLAQSSEFHPIAPAGVAPVVTAASSQYFERTFNRLVAAPEQQPVIPLAPAPPVILDARTTPVIPTQPQPFPADPNIAIAIATAQAAAPVATILLPPYPFGIPPTLGLVPSVPPFNVPSDNPNKESTTQRPSTILTTTTEKDLEVAPLPSSNANSFAQAVPSNENVNFRQYLTPQRPPLQPLPAQPAGPGLQLPPRPGPLPPRPVPQPPRPVLQLPGPAVQAPQPHLPPRPLNLKTTVEVLPVPLTYIAPPPMFTHAHIHSHDHHNHAHTHLKVPKHIHIHSYIPKESKIIIRPMRLHSLRHPARLVVYKAMARSSGPRYPQNALRASPKEREPTTFRPINRPNTKPPRI